MAEHTCIRCGNATDPCTHRCACDDTADLTKRLLYAESALAAHDDIECDTCETNSDAITEQRDALLKACEAVASDVKARGNATITGKTWALVQDALKETKG